MQTIKEVKPYSRLALRAIFGTLEIYWNGGCTPIFQNHHQIYYLKRFEKPSSPLLLSLLSSREAAKIRRIGSSCD